MPTNADPQHQNGSTGSRGKWVLIGFLAIAGFFLLAEHRAHLFGILPYLLLLACLLIVAGFILLASAWKVLYAAQRSHTLATSGPYARIRHPQYMGFILIMSGPQGRNNHLALRRM